MNTIDDIVIMKKEKQIPFGNQFRWLIMEIENNLISKSNGQERVKDLLNDYDEKAKLFIVRQFFYMKEEKLGNELLSILGLDKEKSFLEDRYIDELIDIDVY